LSSIVRHSRTTEEVGRGEILIVRQLPDESASPRFRFQKLTSTEGATGLEILGSQGHV
jgi:hypothetical protein